MALRFTPDAALGPGQIDSIAERLIEQLLFEMGRRPAPSEINSWKRSLPILMQDLKDAGLTNVEVVPEYRLPLTSQRADVVLAGVHPKTRHPSYVVVELKQWSSAELWEDDIDIVTVPGAPGGRRSHPVRQVIGYCDYLVDFVQVLHGRPEAVSGAVYLHNAPSSSAVSSLYRRPTDGRAPMFTSADRSAFQQYLRTRLDPDIPGAPYADSLLNSSVAPSRQLLAVAAEEIQQREQFVLQGNQQLAVSYVKHLLDAARSADSKSVVVITGGPGTGKSVIAMSLLGELARAGRKVLHATGSKSFTMTLRKIAGWREPRVRKLFRYFNQFVDAQRNELDVLILDEAHRIRETSMNRYTRASARTDRRQIDELMAAARVPVFLLDANQVVRPGELGSLEAISAHAESLGYGVLQVHLSEYYRCGGSLAYVRWVEAVLGISGSPSEWTGDERFRVIVADTPREMEELLRVEANDGYTARMTAGYCWRWSDPVNGSLVDDVVIGDWQRPWNVKGDAQVGNAPPSMHWASDPGGIDQVGCIYTAQGFEYDWNGVILGPDIVWRDGHFTTVRSRNVDPTFRTSQVDDSRFDLLVRNVYKVLMTRGMVGTVIYSTDAETRTALRQLVRPS